MFICLQLFQRLSRRLPDAFIGIVQRFFQRRNGFNGGRRDASVGWLGRSTCPLPASSHARRPAEGMAPVGGSRAQKPEYSEFSERS